MPGQAHLGEGAWRRSPHLGKEHALAHGRGVALDEVSDTTMGGLDFLLRRLERGQLNQCLLAQIVSNCLRLISDQPYKLLKEVAGKWSEC